ncbi:MAG: RNB domain-containing ribonuclease [Kofleriaceae bacterium]
MEFDMLAAARRVLLDNGFVPDIPEGIERTIPNDPHEETENLMHLPWSSIDNEESRDLDQIEYAERLEDGSIRLLIGIADVDVFVPRGSPVDQFARANTTSLYTGIHVFPMLPEILSTERTSLLEGGDRIAIITDMVVRRDGTIEDRETRVYPARVTNHAKLVYERVGAWLEGDANAKPRDKRIATQLRLQDEAAQRLRKRRYDLGALDFETIEARPVAKDGKIVDLAVTHKNRARDLIEDLMIAANGATARFLEKRGVSSIRRVVRAPKRWPRIVELAASNGFKLPIEPNALELSKFLIARRAADPTHFADLSLSVVKLMGPGEYAVQRATDPDHGHFGLAVDDYMHSTAPNRRYPDLVTQRLLKATASNGPAAYTDSELVEIAAHCTERENAARKVERTIRKIAAAALLAPRVGETFDAIVTGVADKGTFARLLHPPAEGRVVSGERGLDVGDAIRVRLVDTEPTKGFIDFVAVDRR